MKLSHAIALFVGFSLTAALASTFGQDLARPVARSADSKPAAIPLPAPAIGAPGFPSGFGPGEVARAGAFPQVGADTPYGGFGMGANNMFFSPTMPMNWGGPTSMEESKTEQEVQQLIQQLAGAGNDPTRQKELRSKISERLNAQFDARQERHEKQLEALEAQVAKLRETVKLRQERRSEIIEGRLEQLIRESQGLGF